CRANRRFRIDGAPGDCRRPPAGYPDSPAGPSGRSRDRALSCAATGDTVPIRKRGARYQVRVALGNGRRLERTLPLGATRADARAVEATLIRRQIEIASGRQPSRLISEALDRWEIEAKGLKSYQKDLRYRIDVV